MAINNIDTQFAIARAEVRALIDHCNSNTTIGGRSIDVLQSIVDTLDASRTIAIRALRVFIATRWQWIRASLLWVMSSDSKKTKRTKIGLLEIRP